MKDKSKKKFVIVSKKLYPSQINELSVCCFIVKSDELDDLLEFATNNGGRVLAAVQCAGVSRSSILDMISGYSYDMFFVFTMCPKEITDIYMLQICKQFELNKKGNGKAFVVDVLGYMGAKGPFVE